MFDKEIKEVTERDVKINGEFMYRVIVPPQEFLDRFKHKDIEFISDEFEEMILQDVMRYDTETAQKISRNVTGIFRDWIINKIKKKENVALNCKGTTRSGKSVGMLSVVDTIIDYYPDKEFNTPNIVCANQKEYRQKVNESDFGDVFQIDENAFANVGIGSNTEIQQLKDIQNIIAKQNIHTIYITPRQFLESNAQLGLSTWGKDSKNWLGRYLLYDLRNRTIPLMGYVVIDVGKLFRKYGCFLYKEMGGCPNPNKLTIDDLDKDSLKYSSCIPKDYKKEDLISDGKSCPFYEQCKHPMKFYEKKKDSWIEKEMKGGLDERTTERYGVAIKILQRLANFDENGVLKLKARDGKQLRIKITLYLPKYTGTKHTEKEVDEYLVLVKGFTNLSFLKEICEGIEKDFVEVIKTLEGHEPILDNILEMLED